MSDFTNEAIQVTRRLEEISELLANGDLGRNIEDDLYYERAELMEKDRYLSAYFDVVNKNQQLQTKLAESEARVGRLESGFKEIKEHYGKVCSEFGLCEHESCNSSCAAWMIADGLLNETKSQSLQHIQADAVISNVSDWLTQVKHMEGLSAHDLIDSIELWLDELRQQQAGSDGDE